MARPKKDVVELKLLARAKAQAIESYLNKMEEVYTNYSVKEVNEDKVAEMAMLTGKTMVQFSELCSILGVFEE